jgi:hypothetical protein
VLYEGPGQMLTAGSRLTIKRSFLLLWPEGLIDRHFPFSVAPTNRS